ncbi:hypothetical protein ACQPYA_03880 [Micromonospora sp. CA-263727]|uniref:hypothetical protein n=1 Tax=Micromonospora sp. CA-263727 TaxID=3239967 RepID=UPI003D8B8DAB
MPPWTAAAYTLTGHRRGGDARVGLLEDGRGLAATRKRVDGPGRRHIRAGKTVETVETWIVGGRKATNRAGAAEHLGLAPNTVTRYSSPKGRPVFGWPEPLPERVNGQEVFALDELDAVLRPAPAPAPALDGDPNELIGVDELADLKGITLGSMKRYVEDSIPAWERGKDGYLPRPDVWPPERAPVQGFVYRWRRVTGWKWAFPATRRTSGRKPGRRPQVADLQAVLAESGADVRPTLRELAEKLSSRLGTDVSMQVVRRLRRKADDEATADDEAVE